jgi:hypothetical protein
MADGSFPVWMLEAQDYDGSGIACGLPLWQGLHPDADWRMYCTGLCQEPNPSDVRFPHLTVAQAGVVTSARSPQ